MTEQLRCPISLKIMKNPVKTKRGFTYEKRNIVKWFNMGNGTEPMTGENIEDYSLEEDYEMKTKLETRKTCVLCSKKMGKARYCGGCKSVCYCDKNCQKLDWENHKNICKM